MILSTLILASSWMGLCSPTPHEVLSVMYHDLLYGEPNWCERFGTVLAYHPHLVSDDVNWEMMIEKAPSEEYRACVGFFAAELLARENRVILAPSIGKILARACYQFETDQTPTTGIISEVRDLSKKLPKGFSGSWKIRQITMYTNYHLICPAKTLRERLRIALHGVARHIGLYREGSEDQYIIPEGTDVLGFMHTVPSKLLLNGRFSGNTPQLGGSPRVWLVEYFEQAVTGLLEKDEGNVWHIPRQNSKKDDHDYFVLGKALGFALLEQVPFGYTIEETLICVLRGTLVDCNESLLENNDVIPTIEKIAESKRVSRDKIIGRLSELADVKNHPMVWLFGLVQSGFNSVLPQFKGNFFGVEEFRNLLENGGF